VTGREARKVHLLLCLVGPIFFNLHLPSSNHSLADQLAQNQKPENVAHALLFENALAVDLQFPEQLRTIGFGANTDVTVQNQLRAADNGVPDFQYLPIFLSSSSYYSFPHT
jgi:hypothetical protein